MPNPAKQYHLTFLRKQQLTQDTYSFYFTKKSTDLHFLPGQYMRITLPHDHPDDRGTTRFFTIASSPTETDHIMLTTRVLKSTFKHTLANLTPGTPVKIFAPLGQFILDEKDHTPRILLAGGIGITPYHSMITYAAAQNLSIPLTLFVSFSTTEEMIFYQELTDLAQNYPNLKIIYTITKPEQSKGQWHGETGRISADLIQKYVKDINHPKYYIVGPPVMVEAMHKLLTEMNLPEEKILTENFPGY